MEVFPPHRKIATLLEEYGAVLLRQSGFVERMKKKNIDIYICLSPPPCQRVERVRVDGKCEAAENGPEDILLFFRPERVASKACSACHTGVEFMHIWCRRTQ